MRLHDAAYTSQQVARQEHVSCHKLAKPVVVRSDRGYAMCVLGACYRLDMHKVARLLQAHRVDLASETELAELFPDVETGAEPPFGNLYDLPVYVDERLSEENVDILFQAGSHRRAIRMDYLDFYHLAEPYEADLAAMQ
jgi:Ala-tRNA(Pro) deacylase